MATTTWRALGKCRLLMNATKTATAAPKTTKPTAERPLKGITKPGPVSPTLKAFIGGAPEISRTEAVKKVWDYIKLHNLQNPSDKKEIICDEKLKALFSGKDKVGFMQIAGLLSPHFVKSG